MRKRATLAWGLLGLACGCSSANDPALRRFEDGTTAIEIDTEHGTFDLILDGHTYLRRATSALETGEGTLLEARRFLHPATTEQPTVREIESRQAPDGLEIRLTHPAKATGTLTTVITLLPNDRGVLLRLELSPAAQPPDIMGLVPVHVGEPGSGLFMRSDPSRIQILQNGFEKGMDHYVNLLPGDTPYVTGLTNFIFEGKPAPSSNWSSYLYDRDAGEGLLVGHLSFEHVIPEVVVGFDPANIPETTTGARGFFLFQARSETVLPRPIEAPDQVASETVWICRFSGAPHEGLEAYGDRLVEKFGEARTFDPMAGWNSWYAHRTGIDQAMIEREIDAAASLFGEYGMNTMTLDAGWDDAWGDWNLDPARFPDGMEHLVSRMRSAGLRPILWISPFNAQGKSQLLRDRPEWSAPVDGVWRILMWPGAEPLDLSQDAVIDHVRGLGRKVAAWDFEGVKFDFGYYQIMTTGRADRRESIIESYRKGLRAFREGLGPDPWLMNIHLLGTNMGLVDAIRISNDVWPCWGDDPEEECEWSDTLVGHSAQGLRIGVKMLARRYYLGGAMWSLHPDQVFYRDSLSLEAQRAWASLVVLSGGILSLGDPLDTLSDREIETHRRLLPNLGRRAIPRDLFDREYPEVWTTELGDGETGGTIVALYNWGQNLELSTNPAEVIPEAPRAHRVQLGSLGLDGTFRAYEFWTQSDLGQVSGELTVEVPPRDSRIVILRPVRDRPFVVASNRHISQGSTDLEEISWRAPSRTLSWRQSVVRGFAHSVLVDPAGLTSTPTVASPEGVSATLRKRGSLWSVDASSSRTTSGEIELRF